MRPTNASAEYDASVSARMGVLRKLLIPIGSMRFLHSLLWEPAKLAYQAYHDSRMVFF